MFSSIGRSWELAKDSFRVLRSDKELLLFPLLSFVVLVIVSISFFVPFMAVGGVTSAQNGQTNIASYVVAFLFYVVSYTVTFFFQTALVGAAMIRLDGGDPTLGDGFRIAFARLPKIIGYAIIAATVGMILRFISERAGILGQIVGGVLGFAWTIATFLVVPVLVAENVGPIDAVKRSTALLKQTWGERMSVARTGRLQAVAARVAPKQSGQQRRLRCDRARRRPFGCCAAINSARSTIGPTAVGLT